jgi:hypothetical protein
MPKASGTGVPSWVNVLWRTRVERAAGLEWRCPHRKEQLKNVPLLGNAEKGELERLILSRLTEHYAKNGPAALLEEGVRVIVNVDGVAIDRGETHDPLAVVEVRSLFTALCYITGGTIALPPDSLETLATEATSAAAQQINRIAAG